MQSIQNLPATVHHKTVLDMKITRFVMTPTGRYRTQHYRPLTMSIDNNSLASLGNQMDRANGRLDAIDMNSFAASTMQYSANPISPVHIPNGWDTERYSFELEILVVTSTGTLEERLIGWTEHASTSYSGLQDENMEFIVNSVSKRRLNSVTTPVGTQNVFSMQSASQVFFEPEFGTSYNHDTTPKLVRPYDVYGRLAVTGLDPSGAWAQEFGTGMQGPGTFMDARGSVSGSPETSRRSNSLMGNYLQRTLSAYSTATQAQSSGMTESSYSDFSTVYSEARKQSQILEVPISESDFLQKLSQARYNTAISIQPKFTLGDIYALDPSLRGNDPRFTVNEVSLMTSQFSAADWNGSTHEALAATYLAHSIPAIMVRCGAAGLSLIMQNMHAHIPAVTVAGALETQVASIPVLEQMISTEIMPILTMNNSRSVHCRYICNAMNFNTQIYISINGNDEALFEVPQFADARFSPLITSEMGAKDLTDTLNVTMQSLGVPTSTSFGEPSALDLNTLAAGRQRIVEQPRNQTADLSSLFGGAAPAANQGGLGSLSGLFNNGNSNLM